MSSETFNTVADVPAIIKWASETQQAPQQAAEFMTYGTTILSLREPCRPVFEIFLKCHVDAKKAILDEIVDEEAKKQMTRAKLRDLASARCKSEKSAVSACVSGDKERIKAVIHEGAKLAENTEECKPLLEEMKQCLRDSKTETGDYVKELCAGKTFEFHRCGLRILAAQEQKNFEKKK
jgi:uncharacterized protein YllA (UPF0747 family)